MIRSIFISSNPPSRSSRSSGRKTSNRGSKGQGSNPSGDKDDLEEEDILSHDSDDDPSWGPKKDKNKNKESDIVQNFVPRKRKRIGPDDIGVKKVKNVVAAPTAVVTPAPTITIPPSPAPSPALTTEKAPK